MKIYKIANHNFTKGQKLYFSPKSGYKKYCIVEKINEDGTIDVIDHSGRRMSKFKPVQMGINMFKELSPEELLMQEILKQETTPSLSTSEPTTPRQIYTKDDVIQNREDLAPSMLRKKK